MQGIENLRAARGQLDRLDATPRRRLRLAAREFREAASQHRPNWPLRFQIKAEMIVARLLPDGQIDETVARMDEIDVSDVANDLRLFCDEAERATPNPQRV